MLVRKIEPTELKVIEYDGTNLDAVKQFLEKECDTKIYKEGKTYKEGKPNGDPYLVVSGWYTLFLTKGTHLVQEVDSYMCPSGFYEYRSLEELKMDFVIV